ncbi:MAG: hypothetical protein IT521_03820, partial [Burkholderiales bacterium]|nr:hypothetical protein [Burkholderiales bacterium]
MARPVPNFLHAMASLLAALLLLQIVPAHAALPVGPELSVASGGLWRDVEQRDVQAAGERTTEPERYRLVALDHDVFREQFFKAPMEGSAAALREAIVVSLPMPDGGVARFWIQETQVMAPELAAKFPDIRTWTGQGIDDPTATARLDWTPQGFHAMVLSPATGRVFIDPYRRGDTSLYISYFRRDLVAPERSGIFELPPEDPGGQMSAKINKLIAISPQLTSGTQLRTYRLAVAATGEYTAFFGGTIPLAMGAITTAINRVTGIYEVEVAVRLQLVANNDLIVYTNAGSDPYANNDGSTMLGQNQTNLDLVIGSANYDIGHVFSTGGGGVATLGVPCKASSKARGVTGSPSPNGDAFWVDYVAHEMGHQFGGNHSFNGNAGSCGGGNRNGSTAYEPGSGSTIMAYAGICGAQDLQAHSDAYFHSVSHDEIVAYTTVGTGNGCAAITITGNNLPVPSVPAGGFTIPANTPFALTGSATDADGDLLTYNWEEYDLGAAGPPGVATKPPFFRSWNATVGPTRTFPRLSDLLGNSLATGEVLPNVTRALNFRMTVRDNRTGGGGVAYSTLAFNVTAAAGPFKVTSPDTAITWAMNSTQFVTWNVANTTAAPVGCANVNIELSNDGGLTFPVVLAANTPNDGSQSVTAPNAATTTARVKVSCSSNVFFDISDTNFAIGSNSGPIVTTNAATAIGTAGATLNGIVTSNAAVTTVSFQYGPTLAYGSSIAAAQSPLAAGAAGAAVSAAIGGLACNTLYHYRVVGANADGTANGSDRTFTTASCANSGLGIATIVANPYGPVTVEGATLNGNTISNFQSNAVIQLGSNPGAAGSFAQIDWQGLNLALGAKLTIRSGAAGQSVVLRNTNGVASTINGTLVGQGGNSAAPPALRVANPAGINVAAGGVMQSSSGLVLDALGNTWTSGANIVNAGVADGGTQLDLHAAKING